MGNVIIHQGQLDDENLPLGDMRIRAGTLIEGKLPAEIRLCPNGDIYVNGRLAANDMEVVEGMRAIFNLESRIQ